MSTSAWGMRVYRYFQKGRTLMFGCLFCRVANHQSPAVVLFEDEQCIAIEDIHPQAPVHFLVIPKKHITSLNDDLQTDRSLLGHLLTTGARIAREKRVDGSGFRTVINTNAEAGQTVYHLHVHILGGRRMIWPPG